MTKRQYVAIDEANQRRWRRYRRGSQRMDRLATCTSPARAWSLVAFRYDDRTAIRFIRDTEEERDPEVYPRQWGLTLRLSSSEEGRFWDIDGACDWHFHWDVLAFCVSLHLRRWWASFGFDLWPKPSLSLHISWWHRDWFVWLGRPRLMWRIVTMNPRHLRGS